MHNPKFEISSIYARFSAISLLFLCYFSAISLLFLCYSSAISLLFLCYSSAIPMLFLCYYCSILAEDQRRISGGLAED